MIQPKSRIETGSMDRVEILLNPGSFLRVAENSIVRINETKLDNVRIALDKGIVIVESSVFDKKVHALRIETAAGEIAVQKEGLYRFEAGPEHTAVDVAIRRGKAQWLPEGKPQVTLKSGKRFQLPVVRPVESSSTQKSTKNKWIASTIGVCAVPSIWLRPATALPPGFRIPGTRPTINEVFEADGFSIPSFRCSPSSLLDRTIILLTDSLT